MRDHVWRDLFQDILRYTEEHIDFLKTQIELADKVGIQNYLQSQMGELGQAAHSTQPNRLRHAGTGRARCSAGATTLLPYRLFLTLRATKHRQTSRKNSL